MDAVFPKPVSFFVSSEKGDIVPRAGLAQLLLMVLLLMEGPAVYQQRLTFPRPSAPVHSPLSEGELLFVLGFVDTSLNFGTLGLLLVNC